LAKVFTVEQVAKLLNVTPARIQQFVELGMPKAGRGRYNPAECMTWLLRHQQKQLQKRGLATKDEPQSLLEARKKHIEVQTEREALALAKERGLVIPISFYEQRVQDKFMAVKQRLLALPSTIAPQLEGETRTEIRHKLSVAIRGVLTALATGNGSHPDNQPRGAGEPAPGGSAS